ncbi:MAG: CotH kinase family protein, partial [Prevotella sp.]|nr:CotH kinase family protein [Prevotella sp.]
MKTRFLAFILCLFGCLSAVFADAPIADGVYYIANATQDGYLALGAYHDVDPYIYYVTDGSAKTKDAYWLITYTRSGYTFRNEASGQYLIFTYDRDDAYYKYMTLSDEHTEDHAEYWNIVDNGDGTYCVQSLYDENYYWNLRSGTGLMGAYAGGSRGWNEMMVFHKKGDEPDPGVDPGDDPDQPVVTPLTFPSALHVMLTDGRLEAYPLEYVTSYAEQGGKLVISTNIGKTFTYNLSEVASTSEEAPADFPTFESFKFNNKFNDQVFTDAIGEIVEDTVYVTIAAIGKRLTPSFKVPDGVEVYVDGVLQSSKVSRLRFDKDIYYIVTRPGVTMLLPTGEKNDYAMQPYGRVIRVHVDWLTDRADVPRIYINTEDGLPITSKTEYKNAEITIDGRGIFPSMETTAMQIRGRGNSSWGWSKKPYRLKFAEKVKPLGMTKGKSWVLLANGQTGSLMSNAIGMKAANLMKAAAANHIVPVDVYLNGEYRGSYNFTEKIGFSNNSVDLDDESAAALLELDSYYDEPEGQKFRSQPYNLPINIKEPEFAEGTTSLTLEDISSNFNSFLTALYRSQDISRFVDIEQLVRFMMVNELTLNYEFYHPKSTFCYRESFESDTSKYVFGPVWDLDWCFGYERYKNYFVNESTSNYWLDMPAFEVRDFIRDLRFKYAPIDEVYLRLWEEFMQNDLEELKEYCQDYYNFARNSFNDNRTMWGDRTNYEQQAQDAANWLEARSEKIYEDLVNGVRPDIPIPTEPVEFDNDKLYKLTCRRGALVLNEDHTGIAAGQTRTDAPEEDQLFAIINISGNNFLYSPVTKQYLAYYNNGTWVSELGTAITFDPSHADGEYLYMMSVINDSGSTLYFNNNGQIVINSWSTADAGNRWKIEEAGDFDPTEALALAESSLASVTNQLLFNGKVIASEVIKVPIGATAPNPPADWTNSYVTVKAPADIPYIIDDDTVINYEAEWGGPFLFTTSEDDAHWYNMTIRSDYHVGKQDWEPYYPEVADDEMLTSPEYQWAFGGNPFHVLVYNRASGFSETLTLVNSDGLMREGEYFWDLLPNSDGFVLRVPGTPYSCLNQFGGGGGPLRYWEAEASLTDNGSTFRTQEALDVLLTITADNKTMVYGDPIPQLTYTTKGAEMEGTPRIYTLATSESPVGDYPIYVDKGTVTNGRVSTVFGTLTITKAPLTVGVEDATGVEGSAIPAFTLTYDGFRNGDTPEMAFTTMPTASTTATTSSKAGTYVIRVSGGEAPNYEITYKEGTLTLDRRPYIVTYQVRWNGTIVATATKEVLNGDPLPDAPAELSNAYITLVKSGTTPSTVTRNVTVRYTIEWGGPFQFSTSEDDAHWYNMNIRSGYFVGVGKTEPYHPYFADFETLSTPEFQWAFGGNPYQVFVYNRSTGFSETLSREGDNAVVRPGEYAWDLLPNGDGFVLRVPGTDYCCINQYGGNTGDLKFWDDANSPTDDGSTFRISEAIVDGIEMVNAEWSTDNDQWYDLSGRKIPDGVANRKLPRGVYIK